jgi:carboxypeptidase C (cathepsin A)
MPINSTPNGYSFPSVFAAAGGAGATPEGLLGSRGRLRTWASCLCLVIVSGACCASAAGSDAAASQAAEKEGAAPAGKAGGADEKSADLPVPKESSSVTHHQATIGAQDVSYTATAGTLLIRTGDDPVASVFYVAYTRDGIKDPERRPVTFFYNGGPGSSTMWLHMGSFGPRIVETANAQPTGPAPYHLVNNANSLLDRSDLVFIDAVGTGFSRLAGKGKSTDFWSVDGDVEAFGKFITRYVTLNHRWNSPKFLFGESYGTTRSAALVHHLQGQGMNFNGVVLLSSALDLGELFSPIADEPLENVLPTYAAIAWFHDKIPNKPADLGAFLQQVRDFSVGEYAQALAKGQSLPVAQLDAVAEKLHEFTGLSLRYLKEANIRVEPGRFRKELLRDERRSVGRYDGRFEGIDVDAAGEAPDSDPSQSAIEGAFVASFNSYVGDELNYSQDAPFQPLSDEVFEKWDFKHKLPGFVNFPIPYPMAYVIDDLGQAMRENPRLKVLSANGYFDLATPFFGTERDLNHMGLDPSLRSNLLVRYYPSGHMVYLNPDALKAFRADLATFYDSASQP